MVIPVPDGRSIPLSEDWHVIENCQPNPVTVDLDGDGNLEILFPSYDGRVHAYWLDKSEHGNWPYSVYDGAEGTYRFASEPAVADLNDDGYGEVVFASWVQKGTHRTGRLHILDYQGNSLHEVDLPPAFGSPDWNGALAAPTLANIDDDGDLEVVLNTAHSGIVAYDLPGTAGARILWGTGRGSYFRTGSPLQGTLQGSTKSVQPSSAGPGDVLNYTIRLENPGPDLSSVRVTDAVPADVHYLGNLWASSGEYSEDSGVITWSGTVPGGEPVIITFGVAISEHLSTPRAILNTVLIDDGLGNLLEREALVIVSGFSSCLPILLK
jgi:uncharacterized repeat protein (TIGR01451 family)